MHTDNTFGKTDTIDNLCTNSLLNLEKNYKNEFQLSTTNPQPLLYTIKSSQKIRFRIKSTTSLSSTFLIAEILFWKKTFISIKLRMLLSFDKQLILIVLEISYKNQEDKIG